MTIREDIIDIKKHMSKLNDEYGGVEIKLATLETRWNFMKWLIGANITMWGIAIAILVNCTL